MKPYAVIAAACFLACVGAAPAPAIAQDAMQDMPMPAEHHAARHPAPAAPPAPSGSTAPTAHAHAAGPADAADQAGSGAPAARSVDYSDGYGYGTMPGMDMDDDPVMGMVRFDRLEYALPREGDRELAIDGEAWVGRSFDKLWLKFEGARLNGRLQDLRTEALWSHAVAPFWDVQMGARHDFGAGPGRDWIALGVEGLAPYWFETQAAAYAGPGGRTAARVALAYDARLTQRWILQPSFEADAYGRSDPARGLGAGLSDARVGLRLRYEIWREFAPYVGIVWLRDFGRTRAFARAAGAPAADLQFVVGVRAWH